MKLDFFNQPVAVELSARQSKQDSSPMSLWNASIHVDKSAAMNSRLFKDASDWYIWVGMWKVKLLIETPCSEAFLMKCFIKVRSCLSVILRDS